jgi:hypothetical protein
MSDRGARAKDERVCFVFVCQQGVLETKAMLLAASLRRFLSSRHELVAAVPTPAVRWGAPSPATAAVLEGLGVRTVEIVNRVSPDYPIGNKLDCLAVATSCRRTVFLDTDMLLLRAPDLAALTAARAAAVPASGAHVGLDDWPRFYNACGLPPPAVAVRTLLTGELTPPYFNAGFLSAEAALAPALAEAWSECAARLLAEPDLPAAVRTRFLDQVSLPIAAARLGVEIARLPAEWNFPSWGMRIGDGPLPAFFHYQRLPRLMAEPRTRSALRALLASNDALAEAMAGSLTTTSAPATA